MEKYKSFYNPVLPANMRLKTHAVVYRFAFNGKEKDNETYGTGNAYDFGARIYDARLGRWLSVDPLQAKYPDLSPYAFAASNPIIFIDPDGRYINYFASTGIKEFKLALASTGNGRLAWAALVESKTQVVIKVTNDVLVQRDQAGNFNLVSGQTYNQGKLNKPENGVAYYDKSIINISKGNYRLKKEIEESTGKKFEELSAEEKNSAISATLSSGNYSISEVSNGKTIPLKPEQFPNVKVALPPYENPDPLPDETEAEYMNRISVHEAVHGEHNAIEQYKAGGKASESQLEIVPNNFEKSTIREQKGQRKKKGE